jgi:outer membrane lipoprotein SlyB
MKERDGLNFRLLISVLAVAGVSGCGPSYSPDTYASNAAQQANKADQGVIVGVRKVAVSAAGTVGTLTGAAAGGVAGSQVGVGAVSAFSALGGGLVGGIAGSAVEHATSDTTAFEYIVRKSNGDLVSVAQKDVTPLALGQKVLVIAGSQARVVPDYTVPIAALPAGSGETAKPGSSSAEPKPADAKPADGQPAVATLPAGSPPAMATPQAVPPAAVSGAALPVAGAPVPAPIVTAPTPGQPAAGMPVAAPPAGPTSTATVPGDVRPTPPGDTKIPAAQAGGSPSAPAVPSDKPATAAAKPSDNATP